MTPENKNYLKKSVQEYFYNPPLALIKSMELSVLGNYEMDTPILDLACGDGGPARILFEGAGKEIFGVDIAGKPLVRASSSSLYKGVACGSIYELPYADEKFNTVMSICVLEHLERLEVALDEVRRVLKIGGRFIVTVPSENFYDYLSGVTKFRSEGNEKGAREYVESKDSRLAHFHYYSVAKWTKLFLAAGMDITESQLLGPPEAIALWDRLDELQCTRLGSRLRKSAQSTVGFRRLSRSAPIRAMWEIIFRRAIGKESFGVDGKAEKGGLLCLVGTRV